MPVHESDICIIGAGISSAMLAQKLSELRPGLNITDRRSGPLPLRFRQSLQISRADGKIRRKSLARRLHRRPGRGGRHLADHGGRRAGAALGRNLQSIFGRRSAPEIDVRPVRGLAARMARAGKILLRSRAAPGRFRRAEPVSRRPSVRALSDEADSAHLEPGPVEGMGRQERHPVSGHSAGEKRGSVRWTRGLHTMRHLRYLPHRRALFARFHVQASAGAEENHAARSDADSQTGAGRFQVDHRRRAGRQQRRAGSGIPRESVRGCVGIHVEFAPAAALRQFAISSRASRIAPGKWGNT